MQPADAADALEDPMEIIGLPGQQPAQSPTVRTSLLALTPGYHEPTVAALTVSWLFLQGKPVTEANGASLKARRGRRPMVVSDDEDQ